MSAFATREVLSFTILTQLSDQVNFVKIASAIVDPNSQGAWRLSSH